MIRDQLNISKSTLSNWLSQLEFTPNQEVIKKVGAARIKSALYNHRLKLLDIARGKKEGAREVGTISKRDLFMLGIGLYLGEGSKAIEEIRITNSDPLIIKIALNWFKSFLGIKPHHFRITLHSYPDIDHKTAIRFWSRKTKIPISRFTKTVIDYRKNKSVHRKLQYGTAHLYIRGGGTLKPGIKSLHRKIIGWIEAVSR